MRSVWRLCMLAGLAAGLSLIAWAQQPVAPRPAAHPWSLVVHGGAGVIERSALGPEGDAAYRASLKTATEAGAKVLDTGGSALDAVEAVLNILEDDPLFNAGRGAVFTSEGKRGIPSAWRGR